MTGGQSGLTRIPGPYMPLAQARDNRGAGSQAPRPPWMDPGTGPTCFHPRPAKERSSGPTYDLCVSCTHSEVAEEFKKPVAGQPEIRASPFSK